MTLDSTIEEDDLDQDLSTTTHFPLKEEGLRVPLPLLFITLMILVILSVFDILEKSLDANLAANRRVAEVVLEGAISRADAELNGLALELVSDLSEGEVVLTNPGANGLNGYENRDPLDLLTIFLDAHNAPVGVFSDGKVLTGRERDRFLSGLALQATGINERFISVGGAGLYAFPAV